MSSSKSVTLGSTRIYCVDKPLSDVVSERCGFPGRENSDDPFYIVNLGTIIKKFYQWKRNLPRIKPFYAFKCNDDPLLLKTLALLGLGFDCASRSEMKTVLDWGLDSTRIIYANPCKQISHLKFARRNDVNRMTFDNEYELHKIKTHFPSAELLLRIRADDSKSLCQLGIKFGAEPCHAHHLLKVAKQLELNVIGVSFHVGSGCYDTKPFSDAVASAKEVFAVAETLGFDFSILDVGGGYPGANEAPITFEEIACELNTALDIHFPQDCGIDIIAEPGRFFACASHSLAISVIGKRLVDQDGSKQQTNPSDDDETHLMYYVNDGVYSSFNCLLFDHATVHPELVEKKDPVSHLSSIWGPTCDSMDCIADKCMLPELDIGDWLYFENMGAYTKSAASSFNGFPVSPAYYVVSADVWELFLTLIQGEGDAFLARNPCRRSLPALFNGTPKLAVNSSV